MSVEGLTAVLAGTTIMFVFACVLVGGAVLLQSWRHARLRQIELTAASVVSEAQHLENSVRRALRAVDTLVLVVKVTGGETELERRLRSLRELGAQARTVSLPATEILAARRTARAFGNELQELRTSYQAILNTRASVDDQLDWLDTWFERSWEQTGSGGLRDKL